MSTIPTREKAVIETIRSIQAGTVKPDAIYVNIPEWYPRFKKGPDPNLISELESQGVRVTRCKDYGSLTKVIPTLEVERDPQTLLVVCDDDALYQPRWLEGLVKAGLEFGCPVGYSGVTYPETVIKLKGKLGIVVYMGHGRRAELLECAFGVAYPRWTFDGFPDIEPLTEESKDAMYVSDDYVFSKFMDFRDIAKRVACWEHIGRFHDDWSTVWSQVPGSQTHSLSRDENNLINYLKTGERLRFVERAP